MKRRFHILLFLTLLFPGTALWGQQKATPRNGDGISTFLLRHNRAPKKYYDDFIKLNKKKLGKNNVLKVGVSYIIPPVKTTTNTSVVTETNSGEDTSLRDTDNIVVQQTVKTVKTGGTVCEPLFGNKLANVTVTSDELAGTCFYVVSGHGGPDPGAIGRVGKHQLHEDEYAYDIALRLARSLMEKGAKVHLIIQDAKDGIRDEAYLSNSKRETCMGSPIPLNQVQRLQQRCDKINALYRKDRRKYKYCRAIFIHVDSRGKRNQTDVFFYHSSQKAESKRLAKNMKNVFETKYGIHQPNRGFSGTVSGRNLYVLSHATPTSVFVELGNIQNAFDQRRLVMSSNRQALAKWLMDGFLKDYKAKK